MHKMLNYLTLFVETGLRPVSNDYPVSRLDHYTLFIFE